MKLTPEGKIVLGGLEYDNPLDALPYPKRKMSSGMVSARISFKSIWIDRYSKGEYCSREIRLLSNGKAFIDGKELTGEDSETVKDVFNGLKTETS